MTTTEFNRARAALKKAIKGLTYRFDPIYTIAATEHWALRTDVFTATQRLTLHSELSLAAESAREILDLPSMMNKWADEVRPVQLLPLPLVYYIDNLRLVPLVAPEYTPAKLRTVLVQEQYLRSLELACQDLTLSWWGASEPGNESLHAKTPNGTVVALLMPISPFEPGLRQIRAAYTRLRDAAQNIAQGLTVRK